MSAVTVLSEGPVFHFDPVRMSALAIANRDSFASQDPFPHVVIDSFLPEYVLDQVLAELPAVPRGDGNDMSPTTATERGKTAHPEATFFGPQTTHLLYQLNSGDFLDFLEQLTGIKDLISDMRLDGGGYHLTRRGGRLAIHTDFSHHRRWKIRRRLNLILYLNKDWKDEYGGHLELWDAAVTECKRRILQSVCNLRDRCRLSPRSTRTSDLPAGSRSSKPCPLLLRQPG